MTTARGDGFVSKVDVLSDGTEFKIDGTGVTATAANLNTQASVTAGTSAASKAMVRDSNNLMDGIPVAESQSVDPSQKVTWFTDFLGDLLPDEIAVKAGSGTGNAVALSPGAGGRLSIASASDDGAITANASAMELSALDWRADQGGLVMEARIQCDDISEAYIFVGFTDALQHTTLEAPVFLNAADIDSDATDACGVFYDVDGTTEEWCHGGVKADVDTAPAYSGAAPTQDTYHTVRVEVSATGGVRGYIDGTAIGAEVAAAVTATAPLAPIIVVANRSANQVTCLVDYLWVQADR